MTDKKPNNNDIIKALDICSKSTNGCSHSKYTCEDCYLNGQPMCSSVLLQDAIDLYNRQQSEIERLKDLKNLEQFVNEKIYNCGDGFKRDFVSKEARDEAFEKELVKLYDISTAMSEAVKEFAERADEILKRYAHLHKYADDARNNKDEYADGMPMEMVSVWEVLSLKKWEMCDYETMNTLQDNIENIAKERILTELEKDFMLLKKELVGEDNA